MKEKGKMLTTINYFHHSERHLFILVEEGDDKTPTSAYECFLSDHKKFNIC